MFTERRGRVCFPPEQLVSRVKVLYLFTEAYFHLQNVSPYRVWIYRTSGVQGSKTNDVLELVMWIIANLQRVAHKPEYCQSCQWTVKKPLSLPSSFQRGLGNNRGRRGEKL